MAVAVVGVTEVVLGAVVTNPAKCGDQVGGGKRFGVGWSGSSGKCKPAGVIGSINLSSDTGPVPAIEKCGGECETEA